MVETKPEPNCDPKYVLQTLEALQEPKNKLEYLTDTLQRCNLVPPKKRKKRVMSGYNCFIRVATKKGEDFKKVVKSGAWKQLEDKQKETWGRTAKQGCDNPRLWEK